MLSAKGKTCGRRKQRLVRLGRMTPTARPILSSVVLLAIFSAQRPAHGDGASTFDFPAPGIVAKQQVAYLIGDAMNGRYLAVASRVLLAPARGRYSPAQYQPYLTIYAQQPGGEITWKRVYQSPSVVDRLKLIPRSTRPAPNAPYFPQTSLTLVGAAEFMQPAIQQLVITVHSASADCGGANTIVLGMDRPAHLVRRVAYQNSCSLSAKIKSTAPDRPASLLLMGPYYAASAALCCPTKPHATATASWTRLGWKQRPSYFKTLP